MCVGAPIKWRVHMALDGSPGGVLQLIREGRAVTRTDVMDVTGLSRSTVMQRVGVLLSASLLVEQPEAGPSSGGRRPAALTFNERVGVVLAADLGARHGRLAVCDLGGRRAGRARGAAADRRRAGRDPGLGRADLRRAAGRGRATRARRARRRRSASRGRSRSPPGARSTRRSCPAGTATRSPTGSPRASARRRCWSATSTRWRSASTAATGPTSRTWSS